MNTALASLSENKATVIWQQELAASPPFTRRDLTPSRVPPATFHLPPSTFPGELQGIESEAAQGPFLNRGPTQVASRQPSWRPVHAPAPVWLMLRVRARQSSTRPHGSQAPQDHPLAFTQKAGAQPSPQRCHPGDHVAAKAPN